MTSDKTKEKPLEQIHDIFVRDIHIGHENVRHTDVSRDLDELAASIKRHGLLQPIVLKGECGNPPYELISGQRRFLAHQQLQKTTIRAVFAGTLSKEQAIVRSLVENLQRVELEYGDTAKAVTHLFTTRGKDVHAVQQETGLSVRKIRDFILIEERATPKMKALLKKKKVSAVDVKRSIRAAQDNLKKADELLDLIIKYKPTTYQKRRLVMYGEQKKAATAKQILEQAMEPHVEQNIIISLPDDLREALTKATKTLSLEPEELATKVLRDWLNAQGFAA
ncbi:MAG: ParB/RepB/Spo0J family partition protein [Candidatus Binatus sp.]|uniref:ParB/RepB/Spo0J family partition protein n=1 Tax=Candidatus Binatus sp. TaxID=2811406 RepID=UPI003C77631C